MVDAGAIVRVVSAGCVGNQPTYQEHLLGGRTGEREQFAFFANCIFGSPGRRQGTLPHRGIVEGPRPQVLRLHQDGQGRDPADKERSVCGGCEGVVVEFLTGFPELSGLKRAEFGIINA